ERPCGSSCPSRRTPEQSSLATCPRRERRCGSARALRSSNKGKRRAAGFRLYSWIKQRKRPPSGPLFLLRQPGALLALGLHREGFITGGDDEITDHGNSRCGWPAGRSGAGGRGEGVRRRCVVRTVQGTDASVRASD